MKFIPILFSTPMVKAIKEGRKDITRRIIKPQPIDNTEIDGNFFEGNHKGYVKIDGHPQWEEQFTFEFSKYQKGDILWVRETFRAIEQDNGNDRYEYKESETIDTKSKWKPSIFMPKEACRFFLEVVSVRSERLQDITNEDAIREGVETLGLYPGYDVSSKGKFEGLWNLINGEEGWNSNPFVWVISFKKISRPGNFLTTK